MAYVGHYNKKFLKTFLEKTEENRKTKRIDVLGYGIENQWIIDVFKIVQKIPKAVFEIDEYYFINTIMDVLSITSIEEIIHAYCGVMHEDANFSLDLLYGTIKDKQELKIFKQTKLYHYFQRMATAGRIRAGQIDSGKK